MTEQMTDALQPSLDKVRDLITAMTPDERATAGQVYLGVNAAIALHGDDDGIPAALVMSACIDMLAVASREERRTDARKATG